MGMTKAELVDQVAATVHLSKAQTDAVLTQCLQAIMDALQAGESVELRGFGRSLNF
jgi:nucleoid DNA-binding protein